MYVYIYMCVYIYIWYPDSVMMFICSQDDYCLVSAAFLHVEHDCLQDDSDDDDDMVIKDTDNLLVVGKMTDWMSVLEVHGIYLIALRHRVKC